MDAVDKPRAVSGAVKVIRAKLHRSFQRPDAALWRPLPPLGSARPNGTSSAAARRQFPAVHNESICGLGSTPPRPVPRSSNVVVVLTIPLTCARRIQTSTLGATPAFRSGARIEIRPEQPDERRCLRPHGTSPSRGGGSGPGEHPLRCAGDRRGELQPTTPHQESCQLLIVVITA